MEEAEGVVLDPGVGDHVEGRDAHLCVRACVRAYTCVFEKEGGGGGVEGGRGKGKRERGEGESACERVSEGEGKRERARVSARACEASSISAGPRLFSEDNGATRGEGGGRVGGRATGFHLVRDEGCESEGSAFRVAIQARGAGGRAGWRAPGFHLAAIGDEDDDGLRARVLPGTPPPPHTHTRTQTPPPPAGTRRRSA